jgi:hypothetical protein
MRKSRNFQSVCERDDKRKVYNNNFIFAIFLPSCASVISLIEPKSVALIVNEIKMANVPYYIRCEKVSL